MENKSKIMFWALSYLEDDLCYDIMTFYEWIPMKTCDLTPPHIIYYLFQVQVYELTIPTTYLVEKGKELVVEIQVQPELPVIASYVK